MGKGKDKDSEKEEHVSRPISSLKDPSTFGPPPKHVKYHGAAALPNETTPDRRGLGAPLSQEQIDHQKEQEQAEIEAQEQELQKPAPPPLPYRANRTGVDPSTLPPPPVRRGSPAEPTIPSNTRPKPSIPPRVPPRTGSTPVSHTPSPPPAYSPSAAETPSDPYINQAATSRLAQSGVSVPALGIGNGGNQWRGGSPGTASPAPTGSVGQAPLNELQSRFSQMRTNSPREAPAPPPSRGSYATEQSQSPAPASDTRSAQSTINDFREKHSDKIDAGRQKLSGINEKYGISQRVNGFFDDKKSSGHQGAPPPVPRHPTAVQPPPSAPSASSESLGQRKAPPPPPPKKSGMRSTPVPSAPTPPPIPMGTKPR